MTKRSPQRPRASAAAPLLLLGLLFACGGDGGDGGDAALIGADGSGASANGAAVVAGAGDGIAPAGLTAPDDGPSAGVTEAAPVPPPPTEPLVVVGVLRDPDGRPVAGAPVGARRMLSGLGGPLLASGRHPQTAMTDERGQFELRFTNPGSTWVGPLLDPNVPGGAESLAQPVRVEVTANAPVPPLVFELRPGERLRGRLEMPDELMTGVDPKLLRVQAMGERTGQAIWSALALDGSFDLGPLSAETFAVVASSDRLVGRPVHGVTTGTVDLPLTLERPRALDVRPIGEGASSAQIDCFRDGAHPLEWAKSVIAGRSSRWLLDGVYTVVARSSNDGTIGVARAPRTGTAEAPEQVEVTLLPGVQLSLRNDADGPRIVEVTRDGLPVLAWSAAVGRQGRVVVPAGSIVVRELGLDGVERGRRALELEPGARPSLGLPLGP